MVIMVKILDIAGLPRETGNRYVGTSGYGHATIWPLSVQFNTEYLRKLIAQARACTSAFTYSLYGDYYTKKTY